MIAREKFNSGWAGELCRKGDVKWDSENDRNSSTVGEEKAFWVGGVGGLVVDAKSCWCEIG